MRVEGSFIPAKRLGNIPHGREGLNIPIYFNVFDQVIF